MVKPEKAELLKPEGAEEKEEHNLSVIAKAECKLQQKLCRKLFSTTQRALCSAHITLYRVLKCYIAVSYTHLCIADDGDGDDEFKSISRRTQCPPVNIP